MLLPELQFAAVDSCHTPPPEKVANSIAFCYAKINAQRETALFRQNAEKGAALQAERLKRVGYWKASDYDDKRFGTACK
jgi:hypothetical protein